MIVLKQLKKKDTKNYLDVLHTINLLINRVIKTHFNVFPEVISGS